MTPPSVHVHPRLILHDVDAAITFYVAVFDAEPSERFVDGEGRVVHAAIGIGGSTVSMATEVAAWGLSSPRSIGGSPVLVHLTLPDPDAAAARAVALGAEMVIPLADRAYGKREGRMRDPFGHLWVLSKALEDLDAEQIQERLRS